MRTSRSVLVAAAVSLLSLIGSSTLSAQKVKLTGTVVDERDEGDGLVVANLDGDTVANKRRQMPVLSHAVMWKK